MRPSKTGQAGIDLIKSFEDFSPTMYLCPAGRPTIGYGTLIDTAKEQWLKTAVISRIEAIELMRKDLAKIEAALADLVRVELTQNQYDALVSFCYNVGIGSEDDAPKRGFADSILRKKINIDPLQPGIRAEFMKYNKSGGKTSRGLIRRRQAEADLYFTT